MDIKIEKGTDVSTITDVVKDNIKKSKAYLESLDVNGNIMYCKDGSILIITDPKRNISISELKSTIHNFDTISSIFEEYEDVVEIYNSKLFMCLFKVED